MTIEEVKKLLLEWEEARAVMDALCALTAPHHDDEAVIRLADIERRLLEFARS